MTASPLDHTLIEKNATAVSKLRKEPIIRPTTPKCALEETALFVPVSGPNIAMGARTSSPKATPRTVAASPCQKDSPKMMGNAPSIAVAREFEHPHSMRTKSKIVAVRSTLGIGSMPWCSRLMTPRDHTRRTLPCWGGTPLVNTPVAFWRITSLAEDAQKGCEFLRN